MGHKQVQMVLMLLLASLTACSSVPRIIRRQVDVDTLEEVRVEGHPKWGEEIHAGRYRVKFAPSEEDESPSGRQAGTRAKGQYTATVFDGDRSLEWVCRIGNIGVECSRNGLKLEGLTPLQTRPNNYLMFTTSRSKYDGFTHEERPVVVGVFRNFTHTQGEIDPETNNPWEPILPEAVAFFIRDQEGIRVLLPRGEEHAELRALMVLSVGALGWMNWGVRPGGGGFWAYSPTWR